MTLRIVFLGLSITSSWGNGHATNYRGLVRALADRGHDVLFLERDVPWYAAQRDLPSPPWGRTGLYGSVDEVRDRFAEDVAEADLVVVGSYVPDGVAVGEWVTETAGGMTAFYDLDTPVTVAKLECGDEEYLSAELVRRYDLYLSFTGGPLLRRIERGFGARRACAFYCFADPDAYRPLERKEQWLLGYLGTYSPDREGALAALLLDVAPRFPEARFAVAGPQYPREIVWPVNVDRFEHLPPDAHAQFYAAQRFTLNITRAAMARAGWSPSVRLFEAAACGVPVISDWWEGLDTFFRPGRELLVAGSTADTFRYLTETDQDTSRAIGAAARERVLAAHTAAHRAEELERYVREPAKVAVR